MEWAQERGKSFRSLLLETGLDYMEVTDTRRALEMPCSDSTETVEFARVAAAWGTKWT